MKKSNIYTKTGDRGETSLVGGKRVSKTDPRLEAYGTIDELNSHIGLLRQLELSVSDLELLLFVQNKLFVVGSLLATEADCPFLTQMKQIATPDIVRLEQRIDQIDAVIPKLNRFILPGGSVAAAEAHICRTVCRRAERAICEVANESEISTELLQFVNRLSDYLFILARFIVNSANLEEIFWDKDCK